MSISVAPDNITEIRLDRKLIGQAVPSQTSSKSRFLISTTFISVILIFTMGLVRYIWNLDFWLLVKLSPVLILIIGLLQYRLAQAAHEATHFHVWNNNGTSLILKFFLFYCLGLSMDYRRTHFDHHRHFGNPIGDPDYPTYSNFPKSKMGFLFYLTKSVTGVSAVLRVFDLYFKKKEISLPESKSREIVFIIFAQVSILALLTYLKSPFFYLFFWLTPIFVTVKLFNDLRLLAEHGGQGGTPALRTFLKAGISGRVLAPFGFQYHAEHHLFPEYEYLDLKNVQRAILDNSNLDQEGKFTIEYYNGTHFSFLWKAFLRVNTWT